jgi:hypothetical protein
MAGNSVLVSSAISSAPHFYMMFGTFWKILSIASTTSLTLGLSRVSIKFYLTVLKESKHSWKDWVKAEVKTTRARRKRVFMIDK